MLFKLSLKNIKKSMKDYAIYFLTLILGVAIFYIFNAIESQTVMLKTSSSTSEILEMMNTLLSGVSVFVSIILGGLIIYASRFLIKRRNKEFGIYLTLGMSKRKMSLILFFETLLIGIISLFVGLGIGVLLSQLMSIIVANMFEADMTRFTFTFSQSAFVKTLIYFGIMYLIVILFNTIQVSKCKLIDLLHGAKKSEKQKLKNPMLCTIIFIGACVALGYAYNSVMVNINMSKSETSEMIKIIGIGAVSTFLIFWSLSGLLLKVFSKMKNIYYKGLNTFTLRQFSSKINTMVFSMTVICLMLFITICLLSVAFSLSNSMNNNLKKYSPVDVQLFKKWNVNGEYEPAIIEDSKYNIRTTLLKNNFDIDTKLKDIVEVNFYKEDNFTVGSFIGNNLDYIMKKYSYVKYTDTEKIMKLSDYNKIANLYGIETLSLNNNEYIIVANFENMVNLRNEILKKGNTISINGRTLLPKYRQCKDGFVEMNSVMANTGIFIVSDSVVNDSMLASNILVANYNSNDQQEKDLIEKELNKISDDTWDITSMLQINTRTYISSQSIGLGSMTVFIGLYLGIVFLISSAAILALKELSESADNIERYAVLRKIGTDENIINKALFRQIGIFFIFPLILAIIHSFVGIKFVMKFLNTFGTSGLVKSIIMTASVIVVIYGTYFLITYSGSKNMIKERH